MLIKEYRIPMPVTVEEYQIGQLYAVAEASLSQTGGGDGVEVIKNEPFENEKYGKGQYTYKIYHLQHKVPRIVSMILPAGALLMHEEAWNCFPFCRTVLTNPEYMKENFLLEVVSMHLPGKPTESNALKLDAKELKQREIVNIDIVKDAVDTADYKKEEDPAVFKSEKTGRGPLSKANWMDEAEKAGHLMTCYKLVRAEFKWFGLQGRVEKLIHSTDERLFRVLNRKLYCWIDKWHGMTMQDIRDMEDRAARELAEARAQKELRGVTADQIKE